MMPHVCACPSFYRPVGRGRVLNITLPTGQAGVGCCYIWLKRLIAGSLRCLAVKRCAVPILILLKDLQEEEEEEEDDDDEEDEGDESGAICVLRAGRRAAQAPRCLVAAGRQLATGFMRPNRLRTEHFGRATGPRSESSRFLLRPLCGVRRVKITPKKKRETQINESIGLPI